MEFNNNPKSRVTELVVQELPDELLIYDLKQSVLEKYLASFGD